MGNQAQYDLRCNDSFHIYTISQIAQAPTFPKHNSMDARRTDLGRPAKDSWLGQLKYKALPQALNVRFPIFLNWYNLQKQSLLDPSLVPIKENMVNIWYQKVPNLGRCLNITSNSLEGGVATPSTLFLLVSPLL